jgi:RecB family exonuclease
VLHDGRWAPLGAWELISRDAAVVAGRAEWDELLARYADEREERANELASDPEEEAWRADRARDDAGRARALRGFMLDLIDGLADAAAHPKPWAEHAAWAHDMLARVLGDEARRTRWPVAEQRAAEHVDLALERLGALDVVEGTASLAVFTRTLELELETDVGRVGRLGEGVLVGSIGTGVGVDLDLVIILGLAEGVFPAPVRDDSLLPDEEREVAGGELALRSRRVEREHRELLATIASAGRQVLCVPRGDLRRSSLRVASRWVVDIAGHLAGASWTSADFDLADEPWLDHIPSFAAGLRRVDFPATAQEHRVRDLMATARRGPLLSEHTTDPLVRDAARVIESRRSSDFTRFDGNLAGLKIPSPAETTTSPTRLERWSSCPLTYLFELLRIAEVDNPEERLAITPIDKGNLVHLVLERFIREVLARPRDEQPEPAEPWSDRDRARLIEIGSAVCDEFERRGITGRPIFWHRDRRLILSELERFLDADDEHRAKHSTRPLEAELAFGLKGADLAAVPLQLPDGRCVRFRGKADRVDAGPDGSLHIVDYKTGGSTGYTDLSEENPDQRGKRLQLAVYGVAARLHQSAPHAPVLAEYWFVSRKGRFEHYGYPVTVEVLERVGRTLGAMVAGIEAGIFPAHPTATSTTPRWIGGHNCAACDPDGLGVTELRRAFERKRADPALAPYADLAEPLEAGSESEQPDD